jgi:hypothetical protein
MRRIATLLGTDVAEDEWPALVQAATFDSMKAAARSVVPDRSGVLKNPGAFFRRGRSGAGREVLSTGELERYHARARELAPPDLLAWLHR